MKNGGRITQSTDADGKDAAGRKLFKPEKEGGQYVRIPDPEGHYAELRKSREAKPDLDEHAVGAPAAKQGPVEGEAQNVPGQKYSGRTLPTPEPVRQAVETSEPLAKARADAEKAKR